MSDHGWWNPQAPEWLSVPYHFVFSSPLSTNIPWESGPTHQIHFGPEGIRYPAHREGEVEFLTALEVTPTCACPVIYRDFQGGGYPFPSSPESLNRLFALLYHFMQPYCATWKAHGLQIDYGYACESDHTALSAYSTGSRARGYILATFTAHGAVFLRRGGIQSIASALGNARPRGGPHYANPTYGNLNRCRACHFNGDTPEDLANHVQSQGHLREIVTAFLAPSRPRCERRSKRFPASERFWRLRPPNPVARNPQ